MACFLPRNGLFKCGFPSESHVMLENLLGQGLSLQATVPARRLFQHFQGINASFKVYPPVCLVWGPPWAVGGYLLPLGPPRAVGWQLPHHGLLHRYHPWVPPLSNLAAKANTAALWMNISIDQILLKLFCLNSINPISEPPLVLQILQSLNDHHGSLLNVPLDSPVPFGLGRSVLDTELQLCFTRDEQREKDHLLWLYDYDLPNTAQAAVGLGCKGTLIDHV